MAPHDDPGALGKPGQGHAAGELRAVTDAGGAVAEFLLQAARNETELLRREGPLDGGYCVSEMFRFDAEDNLIFTAGYNGSSERTGDLSRTVPGGQSQTSCNPDEYAAPRTPYGPDDPETRRPHLPWDDPNAPCCPYTPCRTALVFAIGTARPSSAIASDACCGALTF